LVPRIGPLTIVSESGKRTVAVINTATTYPRAGVYILRAIAPDGSTAYDASYALSEEPTTV
jgi:hypothetical protein